MFLTKEEEKMADGEYGETIRKSMDILIALGDIYQAFHTRLSEKQAWNTFRIWLQELKSSTMKTEQSAIKVESQQYPLH